VRDRRNSARLRRATEVKVIVDTAMCTGHGRCYTLAPEVFTADDEGHSLLVSEEVPEALRDKAVIAVENCPERAISIQY
jgi:ferredoxin